MNTNMIFIHMCMYDHTIRKQQHSFLFKNFLSTTQIDYFTTFIQEKLSQTRNWHRQQI